MNCCRHGVDVDQSPCETCLAFVRDELPRTFDAAARVRELGLEVTDEQLAALRAFIVTASEESIAWERARWLRALADAGIGVRFRPRLRLVVPKPVDSGRKPSGAAAGRRRHDSDAKNVIRIKPRT